MRSEADLFAGHTPIEYVGLAAAGQFAREGKLRLLAVMSRNPSSVPAIVAAGYSGLEGDGWVGALVPAGTPNNSPAVFDKLIFFEGW